jgi:hypothetical protein
MSDRHEQERIGRDERMEQALLTPAGREQYWSRLQEAASRESLIGLLDSTLGLPGDIVECGVYRGRSLRLICRTIADRAPDKKVYACDSFAGFPEEAVGRADVGFLRFLSRIRRKFRHADDVPARLRRFFDCYGLNGEVVKGFFSDTLARFTDQRFCFIHLDVDLYESYRQCLGALYDRLVPGGVVVFDEYRMATWPGATRAIDEFFAGRAEKPAECRNRELPAWYVRKPSA